MTPFSFCSPRVNSLAIAAANLVHSVLSRSSSSRPEAVNGSTPRHPAFGCLPPHRDIPGSLEPVKHRVERAVGNFEGAVGLGRQLRDDLIAVGLGRRQEVQDDQLERSPFELPLDASPLVVVASGGWAGHVKMVLRYCYARYYTQQAYDGFPAGAGAI